MKKVWFKGVNPKGTMRPRRMWTPGDILEVEDRVAEELLGETGFMLLKDKPKQSKKAER